MLQMLLRSPTRLGLFVFFVFGACTFGLSSRTNSITISAPVNAPPDSACAHAALLDTEHVVAIEANLGVVATGAEYPVFSVVMDPSMWMETDFTVRYARRDTLVTSDSLVASAWWLGRTRPLREELRAELGTRLLLDAVMRACLPDVEAAAICTYRSGRGGDVCPSQRGG